MGVGKFKGSLDLVVDGEPDKYELVINAGEAEFLRALLDGDPATVELTTAVVEAAERETERLG